MGIKHAYQTATANNATPEVSSNRWNSDHVVDTEVPFAVLASDPAVAASGKLNVFAKKFAQASFPAFRGESGAALVLQSAFWGPRITVCEPSANSTTLTGVGMSLTTVGTVTLRNNSTTNLFSRSRRVGNLSTSSAGALCGYRQLAVFGTTGDGAGNGGFFLKVRFGCSDAATVSGARQFVGLSPNAAPTNVEPNTLINCIGMGHGASDTTLSIYFGGSTAQTPIALGANFPANTLSADVYDLYLYAPSDATGVVYYMVVRVNTGDTVSGTLSGGSAVVPPATTALSFNGWRCNNATALAVGLDFMNVTSQTDK